MRLLCFVTLAVLVASLVGTAFARIDDIGFATPTTDENSSGDMGRIDDIGFSVIRDVIAPVVIVFVWGAL
jgi:hypothetical protein